MGDLLKGKVAVVTGSGQGIGRAIAIGMAQEGAKVVTNNRKPGSTSFAILSDAELNALSAEKQKEVLQLQKEYSGDAETTAQQIRDMGGDATPFFCDISNFEEARKLIEKAVETYGKIDVLANVAGTFGFSPVWEMTEELWDHVTRVKPKGYFNTIRHAAPYMMKQRWGRILNCTSKAWTGDTLRHCEYAAANAGVVGLTRAVATELFDYGITCNAFSPYAKTRASFELNAYREAVVGDRNPIISMGGVPSGMVTPGPEDIGPVLAYLASDETAKISGSVFSVGGMNVSIYEDPDYKRTISKFDGAWTVEELKQMVPRGLLGGYQTHIQR